MGVAFLLGGGNPAHLVAEGGRVHVVVACEEGSPWDGVPLDQGRGEADVVVRAAVELLVPE